MEPHLNAKKLRQAIDDFFLLAPATTKPKKRAKQHIPPTDDGSPRFKLGTTIYKLFDGIQYKGKIISYDADASLYKIRYEDNDEEEMYHLEVKAHLKPIPKSKRKNKKLPLHQIALHKLAPTEMDEDNHCLSLNAQTIRAIAAARLGTHILHFEVSDAAIRLFTLSSENTTDEEASLGHFTRRKLKKLTTWAKWQDWYQRSFAITITNSYNCTRQRIGDVLLRSEAQSCPPTSRQNLTIDLHQPPVQKIAYQCISNHHCNDKTDRIRHKIARWQLHRHDLPNIPPNTPTKHLTPNWQACRICHMFDS